MAKATLNEPAATAAPKPAQSPDDLIRIYNKSTKQYRHGDYLSPPHAFLTVPRWLAKLWLEGYSNDFDSGDVAMQAVNGAQQALIESEDKRKQLEVEKQALSDEIEELRAKISGKGKSLA
jgi:hypothetical protein